MNRTGISILAALVLLLISGCATDGRGNGNTGDNGLPTIGDGDGDNDGSEDGSTDNPGDGDQGDGDQGDGDQGDGDQGDGDGDNGSGNHKWDTLAVPDGSESCGGGGGDDFEFSFLWAANSSQGTISKIETATVTEVGRFRVRPDGAGSPSRTSVSLSGHVAVASRNGGVTKIYADSQFCDESNGMPGIQTSTDNQPLAWGTEECIAWHVPMAYSSQRPVAWGIGELNGACTYTNEELWTAGTNNGGTIDVYVLDGDDGSTKEMLPIPTGGNGLTASSYGIYGGAVDGNGDFWGSQLGQSGRLVRVNRADMTYDIWDSPPSAHWYGMTVDADGMVWLCSSTAARFDPETETWETAQVGGWTGCMADASENGLLWMANGSGVVGVNRDTLQVEKTWPSNGSYGISIDFEGYVWAVASGSNANKIDPETGQVWTYSGLVGAYTYSDMTGYALSNVGTPSG